MTQTDNRRVYRASDLANTRPTPSKAGHRGILGVSMPTLWRWVRQGHLPKPFKLGPNTTVWDAAAVDAFLAARRSA